ncbi:MAG TPA: redoxin domain-containing protein [Chloroflexia bacterium]|nr:redoxin domain-containing protein [Chloroflexia bacterium]
MYAADTVDTVSIMEARRAWPVAENFMPDFKLPSAEMEPVQTSDYRKTRSLVLVFVGECSPRPATNLLSDLARHYAEIARESAEVLVVVRGTAAAAAQFKKRDDLPFPVLADEDGQVHRDYGAGRRMGGPYVRLFTLPGALERSTCPAGPATGLRSLRHRAS